MNVNDFEFATIIDPADTRLTGFRQAIFQQDLNIDPELITQEQPHKWWIQHYSEDAYKYSDHKWYNVKFDVVEVATQNDKVVSMSGAKIYTDYDNNKFLRVNMFYYILKAYRKACNGIIYVDHGYNDRHIEYALQNGCKGMFFTIYVYSPKLNALFLNHTTRRISAVKSKLKHLDSITHVGSYQLNNVPQEFFYYPLSDAEFNPSTLIM